MGMLNWKISAQKINTTNSNSNSALIEVKNCGGFWSIQYTQGLHHLLFGRKTSDNMPVIQSTKYFKEASYQAPSIEALCTKHTETEYTETAYSSA